MRGMLIQHSPQWLEKNRLVDVLRIGDQRQECSTTLGLRHHKLHCRPHGDVLERRRLCLATVGQTHPQALRTYVESARVLVLQRLSKKQIVIK